MSKEHEKFSCPDCGRIEIALETPPPAKCPSCEMEPVSWIPIRIDVVLDPKMKG